MATSYSTLPSSTHVGYGSQGDPYHSTHYGTYDTGIGSLTSHPYQYQTDHHDTQQQPHISNNHHESTFTTQQYQNYPTDNYAQQSTNDYQQQHHLNEHSNSHTPKMNDKPIATNKYAQQSTYDYQQQQHHSNEHSNLHTPKMNDKPIATHNNNTENYATTRTTQPIHKRTTGDQHKESKNHQQTSHAGATQHHPPAPVDNHHHHQTSNHPPKQKQQLHRKSQPAVQSNLTRSERQISKAHTSTTPIRHRSSSNENHHSAAESVPKSNHIPPELKPNKSSMMRAAAIKKKEENLEKKRKDKYFPATENKATPSKSQQASPQTDAEQSDKEKSKRNKKKSQSLSKLPKNTHTDGEQSETGRKSRDKKQSKHHKNRHENYQTEDNNSSADEDHSKHHRSKSQKRTTFPESRLHKHPHLPALRHGRMPPYYDPYMDYPLPPGYAGRGRYPHHDSYLYHGFYPGRYGGPQHLYEDANDIPPYLAAYHDPYDPFFDYERRKVKPKLHPDHEEHNGGYETERDDGAKSQQSRKSRNKNGGRKSRRDYEEHMRARYPPGYYPPSNYYDGQDMLEVWRQERNDYLKKSFKPTIHDVLYSQQWMKSDSYLENQRRRALRDAQGYYFPYKKYTLKDYKDLQKSNIQNPFAEVNDTATIDRKERARKRQEYGALVERQIADNPGSRQIPPREILPRKPWHLKVGELQDPDKGSKRERALEYAKVQVKSRPVKSTKSPSHQSYPHEEYMNNQFPEMNDDGDGSNIDNEPTSKTNQLYDDYDE